MCFSCICSCNCQETTMRTRRGLAKWALSPKSLRKWWVACHPVQPASVSRWRGVFDCVQVCVLEVLTSSHLFEHGSSDVVKAYPITRLDFHPTRWPSPHWARRACPRFPASSDTCRSTLCPAPQILHCQHSFGTLYTLRISKACCSSYLIDILIYTNNIK